jgi:hypothetical protein
MRFFAFFQKTTWCFFLAVLVIIQVIENAAFAQSSSSLSSADNAVIVKSGKFMARDHLVTDLQNNVEWMRCSVGQVWDGDDCKGKALKLSQDDAARAISIANEQLGPGWRLPTRTELEGLVCDDCSPVKIELDTFPNTYAEPYWTGEVNSFASRHIWSVNFMTGFTYGRFFPYQEILVRLVRDR